MSLTPRFRFNKPPPITPPVAIAAVVVDHGARLIVTFDKPLVVQALDPANWQAVQTFAPEPVVPTAAEVSGVNDDEVRLTFATSAEGASSVQYFATPADVVGANGLDVAAFVFAM